MSKPAAALLWGAVLAVALAAGEGWKNKSAEEWTREEALALLRDSPWAREITLFQATGRMLGVLASGEKVVYREAPNLPPRIFSEQPQWLEPETVRAVYAVRWSSARIVQQALKRLRELSPVHADLQAAPPELSDDHYVVTARVVQPPTASAIETLNRSLVRDEEGRIFRSREASNGDLFAGLTDEELAQRATLRTAGKLRLKAERALRHGVGAGEGVSFFFPRQQGGEPTLPAGTKWAEFIFQSARGDKLKAKFELGKMGREDAPDY